MKKEREAEVQQGLNETLGWERERVQLKLAEMAELVGVRLEYVVDYVNAVVGVLPEWGCQIRRCQLALIGSET